MTSYSLYHISAPVSIIYKGVFFMGKRTNTAVWLENYCRWQINVQKNGKRKTFSCSIPGRNGQRECNRKADEWLDDDISNTTDKLSKVFLRYLEELETRTSEAHVKQYTSYYNNWINPTIGSVQIGSLNEQHLQDVINKAYKRGLSFKTLCNIKACLLSFVKFCRKTKCSTLFAEDIIIPQNAPRCERTVLQPEHLKILFSENKSKFCGNDVTDFYVHAYRFAVASGLRPGELIGLEWSDISNGVVSLDRSINTANIVTDGKNKNAKRKFALTELQSRILADQKEQLKKHRIITRNVFCTIHGTSIKEKHLYDRWQMFQKTNGIPPCSLYELRHTFVSITKELPLGLIKPLVGHSEAMDTYGTYSHTINGDMQTTADLIQGVFDKII